MNTSRRYVIALTLIGVLRTRSAEASLQMGTYELPPEAFPSFKACTTRLDAMYRDSLEWERTSRYSRSDAWSDVTLTTEGVKVTSASRAVYKETRASVYTMASGPGTVERSSESRDSESICDGRTMRTTVYQVANEGLPEEVDIAAARRESDERAAKRMTDRAKGVSPPET